VPRSLIAINIAGMLIFDAAIIWSFSSTEEPASPLLRAQLLEFCNENRFQCDDAECMQHHKGHDCTIKTDAGNTPVFCDDIECIAR
jgi:hypothetical protein